jgi:xanthosine utilization system XapX-like protein
MSSPASASSAASEALPTLNSLEFDQAVTEFDVMFRYAMSEGLPIDDNTRLTVATLQQKLASIPPPPPLQLTPDLFGELLTAHIALSKVIAPATPLSLKATEPAPGWLGSLRRPPLVLGMVIVSGVAAIGFVISRIWLPESELTWCCAAALGAVFYVLFTALGYVKDRTFDPRYTPLYVIRFVLGILAGLILAIVLKDSQFIKNPAIKDMSLSVIALLGGFSTEAVYQILQRLVDILVAAVRGDNSDAVKAKASGNAQKELLTLADDPAMPAELKSKAIAAAKRAGA